MKKKKTSILPAGFVLTQPRVLVRFINNLKYQGSDYFLVMGIKKELEFPENTDSIKEFNTDNLIQNSIKESNIAFGRISCLRARFE